MASPTDKDMPPSGNTACPACGKKIAQGQRVGSITSYLFQSMYCNCSGASSADRTAASINKSMPHEFCPTCGLQKSSSKKEAGSITGFLFQDVRCKCGEDSFEDFDREIAAMIARAGNEKQSAFGLTAGTVVGGNYTIIEMVGQGGMGEVYLAKHGSLEKPCALKIIQPENLNSDTWQRFQLEAKSHANLDHINLVKVTDLGIHNGYLPYYAMEYIQGLTLAELLERRTRLPLNLVMDIFLQVCDGVNYAHRKGLLHRDLKPSNIMLVKKASDKGSYAVKVVDFGLAKQTNFDRNAQSLTREGIVVGSPFYMSPEQCAGEKVDLRSDIYSLGCALFEALTGKPPFAEGSSQGILIAQRMAEPPTLADRLGPGVMPASMEIVLAKLLRKDPAQRYQNLLELRGDLEKIASGNSVQPIYVSRAADHERKGANGSVERRLVGDDNAEGSYKQSGSNRPRNWLPMAALAAAIVSFAGAAIYLSLGPKLGLDASKKDSPKAADDNAFSINPFDNNIDVARPASINDKTPYLVEEKNGLKTFNFPPDILIGTIWMGGPPIGAKGRVTIPADKRAVFEPSPYVHNYPEYLNRIKPGDFEWARLSDTDFLVARGNTTHEHYFKILAQCDWIHGLDLTCATTMTDEDLVFLDQFKHLEALEIVYIDGLDKLPNLPAFRKLKRLTVEGRSQSVLTLLKGLQACTQLRDLAFPGRYLTVAEQEELEKMTYLQRLGCEGLTPDEVASTNAFIEALTHMPKLESLTIVNAKLDKSAIGPLNRLKALRNLCATGAGSTLTRGLAEFIKKEKPGLTVEYRLTP